MLELIPEDLFKKILGFLSLKERKVIREVNIFLESHMNTLFLLQYKLDNFLKNNLPIEMKLQKDLIFYKTYNNCTIYKIKQPVRVHSLFAGNNIYDKCIVDICREKKVGYLFYSTERISDYHQSHHWKFYSKHNIPYCSRCIEYLNII